MMEKSDGKTAGYYELPENARELQDIIAAENMNAQIAEIFRACKRYGKVEHSSKLRDARKMRFYAQAEIDRLMKYEPESCGGEVSHPGIGDRVLLENGNPIEPPTLGIGDPEPGTMEYFEKFYMGSYSPDHLYNVSEFVSGLFSYGVGLTAEEVDKLMEGVEDLNGPTPLVALWNNWLSLREDASGGE